MNLILTRDYNNNFDNNFYYVIINLKICLFFIFLFCFIVNKRFITFVKAVGFSLLSQNFLIKFLTDAPRFLVCWNATVQLVELL